MLLIANANNSHYILISKNSHAIVLQLHVSVQSTVTGQIPMMAPAQSAAIGVTKLNASYQPEAVSYGDSCEDCLGPTGDGLHPLKCLFKTGRSRCSLEGQLCGAVLTCS